MMDIILLNKLADKDKVFEVPFEIRLDFFEKMGAGYIKAKNDNDDVFRQYVYNSIAPHLFKESEVEEIIDKISNYNQKWQLFKNLSDEKRATYFEEVLARLELIKRKEYKRTDNYMHDLKDFFEMFKDKKIVGKLLFDLYFTYKVFRIPIHMRLFKYIDEPYLGDIFMDIIDNRIYELPWSFPFFKEGLEKLPTEKKYVILKKMIDHDKTNTKRKIIETNVLYELLQMFDESERIDALIHFKDLYDESIMEDIVPLFKKEEWEELIKITNYKISNTTCFDFGRKNTKLDDPSFVIDLFMKFNGMTEYILMSIVKEYYSDINDIKRMIDKYSPCFESFEINNVFIMIDSLLTKDKYKIFSLYLQNEEYYKYFDIIDAMILNDLENNQEYKMNLYPEIIKMYISKYNLNEENLNEFIEKYGPIAIKFVRNENIKKIINADKETFNKILNIFSIENAQLTLDDINKVCNSFVQSGVKLYKNEYVTINTRMKNAIDNKNRDQIRFIINEVSEYIDIDSIIRQFDINSFIEGLINQDDKTINDFSLLASKYLDKRNDLIFNILLKQVKEKIKYKKIIKKSYYVKTYIQECYGFCFLDYSIKNDIGEDNLSTEERELYKDKKMLELLYNFKKNPVQNSINPEAKKKLKVLNSILGKLYDAKVGFYQMYENENTEFDYLPKEATMEDLLNIMMEINVNIFEKNIVPNQKIYEEMIKNIKEYKLIGWSDSFTDIYDMCDVVFYDGIVSSIINYFNKVKLSDKSSHLMQLIDFGREYDATSKRYMYLLGKEDFKLISNNPGKNKASMIKSERLQNAANYIKKMYEKEELAIPPIDRDFMTKNGKKLNVVLGNATNTMNLTYGERTEACLRIGGAFYDTFEFCLLNKNGFHIRFSDPITGEFVSRVSGIRNGNTVFLNELRNSVDKNYSNEDLYDVLKQVGDYLIEATKNTDSPIENVIVSSDYALDYRSEEEIEYNIEKDLQPFHGLNYNVKKTSGIVVSTVKENNELVPFNFYEDPKTTYKPQRDKIRIYEKDEATSRVIQLKIIDELLEGKELSEIIIDSIEFEHCISGEDWFIAETKDKVLVQFIMNNTKNKKQAYEEMSHALNEIYINEKKAVK